MLDPMNVNPLAKDRLSDAETTSSAAPTGGVDVSVVLPCLNEAVSLAACINRARALLDRLRLKHGLVGEIVVADNGSSDNSQAIARALGARVVDVDQRGYGSAIRGGFTAANGRFLVMGDADGSYDFLQAEPMVMALMDGADLAMGSRFQGEIKSGAMPWKNRYLGNPALTGVLNILFRSGVSDAHCGLRAVRKQALGPLRLSSTGMEFASEMVVKAALLKLRVAEFPITLSPDLRTGRPHLRPWRDGWHHLRYLLMLSPLWLFLLPAAFFLTAGTLVLLAAASGSLLNDPLGISRVLGDHWALLGGSSLVLGHQMAVFGIAGQLYAVRNGYRQIKPTLSKVLGVCQLDRMLVVGVLITLAGAGVLARIFLNWSATGFSPITDIVPAILGLTMVTVGLQNFFAGFFLSIIADNHADLRDTPSIIEGRHD